MQCTCGLTRGLSPGDQRVGLAGRTTATPVAPLPADPGDGHPPLEPLHQTWAMGPLPPFGWMPLYTLSSLRCAVTVGYMVHQGSTTVSLANVSTTSHSYHFSPVLRTFEIYPLNNVHIYDLVLITVVTSLNAGAWNFLIRNCNGRFVRLGHHLPQQPPARSPW